MGGLGKGKSCSDAAILWQALWSQSSRSRSMIMHPWTVLMLRAPIMTTNMLETLACLRRSRWNRAALRSTSLLVQPRVPGRKLTTTCSLGAKRTGFNSVHSTRLTAQLPVASADQTFAASRTLPGSLPVVPFRMIKPSITQSKNRLPLSLLEMCAPGFCCGSSVESYACWLKVCTSPCIQTWSRCLLASTLQHTLLFNDLLDKTQEPWKPQLPRSCSTFGASSS